MKLSAIFCIYRAANAFKANANINGEECDQAITTASDGRSGTITASYGEQHEIWGSWENEYGHNLHCQWDITAENNCQIEWTFTKFDVANHNWKGYTGYYTSDCDKDSVEVWSPYHQYTGRLCEHAGARGIPVPTDLLQFDENPTNLGFIAGVNGAGYTNTYGNELKVRYSTISCRDPAGCTGDDYREGFTLEWRCAEEEKSVPSNDETWTLEWDHSSLWDSPFHQFHIGFFNGDEIVRDAIIDNKHPWPSSENNGKDGNWPQCDFNIDVFVYNECNKYLSSGTNDLGSFGKFDRIIIGSDTNTGHEILKLTSSSGRVLDLVEAYPGYGFFERPYAPEFQPLPLIFTVTNDGITLTSYTPPTEAPTKPIVNNPHRHPIEKLKGITKRYKKFMQEKLGEISLVRRMGVRLDKVARKMEDKFNRFDSECRGHENWAWEESNDDGYYRYDKTNPCRAAKQLPKVLMEWADAFNVNCFSNSKNFVNRMGTNVEKIEEKIWKRLEQTGCGSQ